jgi:hypothetical protein
MRDKDVRRTLTLSGAIKPARRRAQIGDPIAIAARRSEIKTKTKVAVEILARAAARGAQA